MKLYQGGMFEMDISLGPGEGLQKRDHVPRCKMSQGKRKARVAPLIARARETLFFKPLRRMPVIIRATMWAATAINMVVAGLSGTLIPLGLEKFKIDPAVASSVFLPTVTDVIGFFAFLGLAAVFLL